MLNNEIVYIALDKNKIVGYLAGSINVQGSYVTKSLAGLLQSKILKYKKGDSIDMEYRFRKCTLEDIDFLFDLKKQNFKWYVDKIWGWNEEDQHQRLKQDLREHLEHKRIILVDDKMVGVYAAHKTDDGDLFINEISILKEYQNKGIGSDILREQILENRQKGIRTVLQVFKDNPAKNLYERLGFKVYGENETHYQMENIKEDRNIKKITIEMACSINGLIATEDGNEDFLAYRGWEIMLEFLKEYDVLIWGRKTWENILSWGDDYLNDLKDINIIILSEKSKQQNKFQNVVYCNSIEDCLKLCEKLKYEKLFISGGATINNAFMEKGIVNNIILNYNPFVLNKGIPLFKGNYFENKLKLEKIVREQEDIVQVHYSVIN